MKVYFCSQHTDIKDKYWQNKSCTLCSLWMALKSLNNDFNLSPDELLEEALFINSFVDPGYWNHSKISILAHNYGSPAYNEEFKSFPFGKETKYAKSIRDFGVEKIFNFIKNKEGFVIVSIPKDFIHFDKPHSVLIHNVEEKEEEGNIKRYFIYNDSEKLSEEEGANLRVSEEEFKEKWRRLAIFINKIDR